MSNEWKPQVFTDRELEILKLYPVYYKLYEESWTMSETDRDELRVATNRGFKRDLKRLAWEASFLHYLTDEQRYRVQSLIDELAGLFREDTEKSADAIGQAMIESIKKRPPVH